MGFGHLFDRQRVGELIWYIQSKYSFLASCHLTWTVLCFCWKVSGSSIWVIICSFGGGLRLRVVHRTFNFGSRSNCWGYLRLRIIKRSFNFGLINEVLSFTNFIGGYWFGRGQNFRYKLILVGCSWWCVLILLRKSWFIFSWNFLAGVLVWAERFWVGRWLKIGIWRNVRGCSCRIGKWSGNGVGFGKIVNRAVDIVILTLKTADCILNIFAFWPTTDGVGFNKGQGFIVDRGEGSLWVWDYFLLDLMFRSF